MRTLAQLLRPTGIGGLVGTALPGMMLLFFLTSALTGQYDLQRLRADGTFATYPVAQVIERDSSGIPTVVRADLSTLNGRTVEVHDAQGSLRGPDPVNPDQIEVRMTNDGALILAAEDFTHRHLWWEVLRVCLIPIGIWLVTIVALNFRRTFLTTTVPSHWARTD